MKSLPTVTKASAWPELVRAWKKTWHLHNMALLCARLWLSSRIAHMSGTSSQVDTKSMTHRFTINKFTALVCRTGVLRMTQITKMFPGMANTEVRLSTTVVVRYVMCRMWNNSTSESFDSSFDTIVDSIAGRDSRPANSWSQRWFRPESTHNGLRADTTADRTATFVRCDWG